VLSGSSIAPASGSTARGSDLASSLSTACGASSAGAVTAAGGASAAVAAVSPELQPASAPAPNTSARPEAMTEWRILTRSSMTNGRCGLVTSV
jgi:hypothetical protein